MGDDAMHRGVRRSPVGSRPVDDGGEGHGERGLLSLIDMWRQPAISISDDVETRLGASGAVRVELGVEEHGADEVQLHPVLVNGGDEDLVAEFLRPLRLRIPVTGGPSDHRVMVHGYQSFAGTGSFDFTGSPPIVRPAFVRPATYNLFAPPTGRRGHFVSSMFTTVCRSDGSDPLTIGTTDPSRFVSQITIDRVDGAASTFDAIDVAVQVQLERVPIGAGAIVELPPIVLSTAPIEVAQRRWAQLLAARVGVRQRVPAPDGYCSWYRHYTKISDRQLRGDLEAVASAFGSTFPLFHVDDGYQSAVGDWLSPSPAFPNGVRDLVPAIEARGLRAGLWVAPFFALANSEVARRHPDWLLRDARGRPVVGMWNALWDLRHTVRVLDATHPEVVEHLVDVFRTLRGHGFSFFKLDFLYASMLPGQRRDRTVRSVEGARAALAAIRDAVGPDAFLLGCGCPVELAVGLVDATRSSGDVTPAWRQLAITRLIGRDFETLGTYPARRNVVARSFQHRVLFENDPDCLFAYAPGNRLTRAEGRLLLHTNAVAGGPLMFATSAADLDEEQVAYVERAREINREVAATATRWWSPDAMLRFDPRLLAAAGPDRGWLAVSNPTDDAIDQIVDLREVFSWPDARAEVVDANPEVRTSVRGGIVRVGSLPAHDSVLLRIDRGVVG